jgi:hypothetical protein
MTTIGKKILWMRILQISFNFFMNQTDPKCKILCHFVFLENNGRKRQILSCTQKPEMLGQCEDKCSNPCKLKISNPTIVMTNVWYVELLPRTTFTTTTEEKSSTKRAQLKE